MSRIDADAFAYLGEVRETASQLSDLLQEAYKTLGASQAIYERSRWLSEPDGKHGSDLTLYGNDIDLTAIKRFMGYLAGAMLDLDGATSTLLEAARSADGLMMAADDQIRSLRDTHTVEAISHV
jgi:hypothetical protein